MTEDEIIEYIELRSIELKKLAGKYIGSEQAGTSGQLIAMAYELDRLKRHILDGRISDRDLDGWLLIYAGSYQPVDEYLTSVQKQTGLDRARVAKAMWDLVEQGKLEYTTDAKVKAS